MHWYSVMQGKHGITQLVKVWHGSNCATPSRVPLARAPIKGGPIICPASNYGFTSHITQYFIKILAPIIFICKVEKLCWAWVDHSTKHFPNTFWTKENICLKSAKHINCSWNIFMNHFEKCFQESSINCPIAPKSHIFHEYSLPDYIFMKEHRGRGIFMHFPCVYIANSASQNTSPIFTFRPFVRPWQLWHWNFNRMYGKKCFLTQKEFFVSRCLGDIS